jgi:23S rRNA (cytidine1920-2'-O)/16S rRNA (cytidine1409-2'-O)-methyltransferase
MPTDTPAPDDVLADGTAHEVTTAPAEASAAPDAGKGTGRATTRLDAELVRRGLARARGQADELVRAGRVQVDGRVAKKVSQQVTGASDLVVEAGEQPDYVGRGALKLAGLLDDLGAHGAPPLVQGRRCLDAGASTGGFTQVLLERGARSVVAVDVGHGQLAAPLREDERVVDREGTSVRGLTPDDVAGRVDLLVADLSFISVTVVLGDLVGLVRRGGDLLVLVKPQFEVGRERLGAGGVVRDVPRRVDAVLSVLRGAVDTHGLAVRAVRASRWPGPSGNVEYFVWLTRPGETDPPPPVVAPASLEQAVRHAVKEGPQ